LPRAGKKWRAGGTSAEQNDTAGSDEEWPGSAELRDVAERLRLIEQQGSEFHRRSAHRESVIDRLHAENQELESAISRSALEPVAADLLRLFDALGREAARLTGAPPDPAAPDLLWRFAEDVELILDRCGFEPVTAVAGDRLTVGEHAVSSVADTADQGLDGTVAQVIASGMRDRATGRVRRPLKAQVYRFTGPPEPAGEDGAEQADATAAGTGEGAAQR
jgi:molecular chaperone GrpE